MFWEHWGARRPSSLSQGSRGGWGCNRRLRFSRAARPKPLSPCSAGERAAQSTGSYSPWPTRASGGACRDRDLPCCDTRHRALGGDPRLLPHGLSKNHPKMRTLGHCLPGLAPAAGKRWGVLHATTAEPSHPSLVPLSYHWQTWGCSLFHFTHRN